MLLVESQVGAIRVAFRQEDVVEVVGRVHTTPLPGAPRGVVGLVRFRGELAVAVDVRTRFSLEPKAPSVDDHFVVVHSPRRLLALIVDRATALLEADDAAASPPPLPLRQVRGLLTLPSGVVFVHDVGAAFSLEEEE